MGIIDRFSDIMKSNINALLDKCEDPAKMADQMERDLREKLAVVKKETAGVMAAEKQAKRVLDDQTGEVAKYANAARNAVMAGADDDAKKLLATKQKLEAELPGLEKNYAAAKANADKMREMHDKLVSDIEFVAAKKSAIKAKIATAKAQEAVNDAVAGMNGSASMAAFDRMNDKADRMLDAAMARAELDAGRPDDPENLAEKYSSGAPSSVDDELAKLKSELAGGNE